MDVVEVLLNEPVESITSTPPVNATAFDWPPQSGATLYGSTTTGGFAEGTEVMIDLLLLVSLDRLTNN